MYNGEIYDWTMDKNKLGCIFKITGSKILKSARKTWLHMKSNGFTIHQFHVTFTNSKQVDGNI
jgi:hypothetical protein